MKVELLYFEGCPNWRTVERRLRSLAEEQDFDLHFRLVSTPEEAEAAQFRGSPTIVIDGRDPFAQGDEPFGLSCRLYRTPDGPAGAPTIEMLRAALVEAVMTARAPTAVDALDDALARATPRLSADGRLLAVAIYRLLAVGEPVKIDAAAARAGLPPKSAADIVGSWPAVFTTKGGRIVGFWGLALDEMPHRLRSGGVELSAWCAWDPLFLAPLIGDLDVATNDPITGNVISYRIDADGQVSDLSHPETVLSFVRPEQTWDDRVMETFCHHVLQFTKSSTAATWTESHPGTFVIGFDDAKELARRHAARIAVGGR